MFRKSALDSSCSAQATCCFMQAAAQRMAMSNAQIIAVRALRDSYIQEISAIKNRQQQAMAEMQATQQSSVLLLPNHAGSNFASLGRLSSSLALQQETSLHVIRRFLFHILTPFQAGLLCAASYPFLIEFPAVIEHLLEAGSSAGL